MMQDNYIVRQSGDRLVCFFSSNENSILYRIYENNKWSTIKELLTNTLNRFTVTVAKNGNLYIFCQNLSGDILLCTSDRSLDEWSNKIILKNQSDKNHTILFQPIIKPNGLCILYNIPSDSGNLQLVSQNLDDTGAWAAPVPIDDISIFRGNIFEVQNVTSEHLLVFYQSNRSENNIGYREVTSNKWSDFKPIHLTSYQILDKSFVTTNDSIHALYVVKSIFAHQIIYRKKTTEGFGSPLVIWEGQKMDNCLLSIIDNTIYATFKSRNQMFISSSKDSGDSFTRPEVYKDKICANPKKAIYITETPMNENEYFVREVYVDSLNAWDIQMLPKMYESFYPTKFSLTKPPIKVATKANASNTGRIENTNNINTTNPVEHHSLQLELKRLQEQNRSKEEQIAYMTNIISNYKSQKEDIDFEKSNIENKYAKDMQDLKNKIIDLEFGGKELNAKIMESQNSNEELELKLRESQNLNSSLELKLRENQKLNSELELKLRESQNLNSELELKLEESQNLNSSLELKLEENSKNNALSIQNESQNNTIDIQENDVDNRIITIQSTNPTVLIPYRR